MAVEIGSLTVRATFRSADRPDARAVAPADMERELRRLHRRVLADVQDMIEDAERRRRER